MRNTALCGLSVFKKEQSSVIIKPQKSGDSPGSPKLKSSVHRTALRVNNGVAHLCFPENRKASTAKHHEGFSATMSTGALASPPPQARSPGQQAFPRLGARCHCSPPNAVWGCRSTLPHCQNSSQMASRSRGYLETRGRRADLPIEK